MKAAISYHIKRSVQACQSAGMELALTPHCSILVLVDTHAKFFR
jgi:hypothetical protein